MNARFFTISSKRCPLCKSDKKTEAFFTKNSHRVLRCRDCWFGFVDTSPERQDLENLYDKNYFEGDAQKFGYHNYLAEKTNRVNLFQTKSRYLESLFPEGGRLLDVGCADGSFLELFSSSWRAEGVELSKAMWEKIPTPLRNRVFQGFFEDFSSNEPFDVITLWDVLDHVVNPRQTLEKAYSLLKPGGILGIVTGDMESLFAKLMGKYWYLYIPPVHLSYFSRPCMEKTLTGVGFEFPQIAYEGKRVSLALTFYRIAHLFPWRAWQKTFQKISSLLSDRVNFNLNFFDVMTIWARKPYVRN